MKILAVANQPAMLEALQAELQKILPKAEILKETDALMAGKYAFNHAVDIVFAKADMKRMSGLQLIRFVKHEHPGVKGFLVEAENQPSALSPAAAGEVAGVLTYPFAENAVCNALQRCAATKNKQ